MMNIDNRFPGVYTILITPGTLQNPKLAHASNYFLITMRPTPDAYTIITIGNLKFLWHILAS